MKRAHSSWPSELNVHEAWIVSCRRIMSWLMSNVVVLPSPTKQTRPQVAALFTAATRASGFPVQSMDASTPAPWVSSRSAATGSVSLALITASAPSSRASLSRSGTTSIAITRGPLAEDRERVAPGDVEALERAVGGAGPTRDRGALLEAERFGQRHERARGHLHVGRVSAVARHAVDDDAVRTELRPADAAVLAAPAALVVVVHHPRAGRRLVLGDAGPARREAERGGGIADGAVGMEIAPAHARGLDGDDDLARARCRVGELAELELPVAEKDDALHLSILCACRSLPGAAAPSGAA